MQGRKVRAAWAAVLAVATLLPATHEARAQEAPAAAAGAKQREEEARAAILRGLSAYARGNVDVALEEYRRAQSLVPNANLPHRYEAEALVSLGRFEEAIAAYEKYLLIKPDVSDAEQVRARIEELRARRKARAVVQSTPPGATVFVDGAAQSSGATPTTIEVSPGPHRFVLRREGFADAAVTTVAPAGGSVDVAAELVRLAPSQGSTPERHAAREGRTPATRTLGLVVGGVGLGALATAAVLDLAWVGGAVDDFEAAQRSGSPAAADALVDAEAAQRATLVTFVAGGVLAVAGAVLFLWPSGGAGARARATRSRSF